MNEQAFDLQGLLDKLLNTGKEYVEKGQDYAEDKLNIPEQGPEKEVMLDGMKKGAIASALLVGLLGTKGGRSLTGTALKIGGLAALGTAAYKAYQNWQDQDEVAQPVHELPAPAAISRSQLLIEAMVSAANADGRIDDAEQSTIKHEILEMRVSADLAQQLEQIIDAPLSPEQLGAKVTSRAEAGEVYLATRLLIDDTSGAAEQQYRERLIEALGLSREMVNALDSQIV